MILKRPPDVMIAVPIRSRARAGLHGGWGLSIECTGSFRGTDSTVQEVLETLVVENLKGQYAHKDRP
jgi:hypothetical protein